MVSEWKVQMIAQEVFRACINNADDILNLTKSMLEKHNVKVTENTILTGNPSHEIIQYARLKEIDLIVLGSRNKSLADRLLTGSESKRILENTSSDVLLVRCHI